MNIMAQAQYTKHKDGVRYRSVGLRYRNGAKPTVNTEFYQLFRRPVAVGKGRA